jgi:hypothetical protein
MRSLALVSVLALGACGGHSSPSPPPHAADTTPAALPGNAAVQARLGALPAPPRPWSNVAASLPEADFVELCPWLNANIQMTGGQVSCPDGTSATISEHVCEPAAMASAARCLPCAISWGEIVACRIAMVEHPCDGGPLGENLEECRAFDSCNVESSGAAP